MKLRRAQCMMKQGIIVLWLLLSVAAEAAECRYASKATTDNRQPE
jgi:hypothetical protein